jgi:hypothetical protein
MSQYCRHCGALTEATLCPSCSHDDKLKLQEGEEADRKHQAIVDLLRDILNEIKGWRERQ